MFAEGVQYEVAMHPLSPNTTGLALGGLFAVIHLVWAIAVALGIAQPFMNFVFRMHMLTPVLTVEPFSVMRAVVLIILTAVVGYVLGWLFAKAWNMAQG